jgi:hypothetical protein
MRYILLCIFLLNFSLLFSRRQFTMKSVGSYTVINKTKPIRINFEFLDGDIMLHALIIGKECTMFLDNGYIWDELYFFGSPIIDSLHFNFEPEEVQVGGQGSGSMISNKYANGVSIDFENIHFTDQPAIISPPELGLQKLFRADGQISACFFKNFIIKYYTINAKPLRVIEII